MSVEQATEFVHRLMSDAEFREQLAEAPIGARRDLLVSAGFGDVKLSHVSEVLPTSAGGELSDDEFRAVAGGDLTTAITVTAAGSAAGGAVSGAVAAAAAVA